LKELKEQFHIYPWCDVEAGMKRRVNPNASTFNNDKKKNTRGKPGETKNLRTRDLEQEQQNNYNDRQTTTETEYKYTI